MISYLIGKIVHKNESSVIVETSGIGYEVFASSYTMLSLPVIGEETQIFTYLCVRDDGISLIGFSTQDERNMFLKLITVSGIGPKLALSVLSGISFSDLIVAIATEDVKTISQIKNVGKKTSERIVLELKDKVYAGDITRSSQNESAEIEITKIEDATYALVSLGLSKQEATRLVKSVATANDSVEDMVSKALRGMGR